MLRIKKRVPKGTVYVGFNIFETPTGKLERSPLEYYFDKDKNELGYKAPGFPINESTKGRKWSKSVFNSLTLKKVEV